MDILATVAVVSGYKSHEFGIFKQDDPAIYYIKKAIKKELVSLIEDGLEWVLISGQLGVELWTAEVIFELQDEYPDIKLAVLTPFEGQEENWNEGNKEYYQGILAQADFVESISKGPYKSPQQFRNRNHLFLHKSQVLVLLYDEEKEGSPKFLLEEAKKFKEQHSYEIRLISFMDLQWIVEEEQWQ